MNTPYSFRDPDHSSALRGFNLAVLGALMELVRLPLLAVLRLVGPLIRVLLGTLGFLSLFTAAFFELTSRIPSHALIALVAFGVGCGLTLLLYEKAIRRLSR